MGGAAARRAATCSRSGNDHWADCWADGGSRLENGLHAGGAGSCKVNKRSGEVGRGRFGPQ
jgi:hypothetical protein